VRACVDPLLTVYYRETDYDASSEYFSVTDNFTTLTPSCGALDSCGWSYCLFRQSISTSLLQKDTAYTVTIYISAHVSFICDSIHINVTLICQLNDTTTSSSSTSSTSISTSSSTSNFVVLGGDASSSAILGLEPGIFAIAVIIIVVVFVVFILLYYYYSHNDNDDNDSANINDDNIDVGGGGGEAQQQQWGAQNPDKMKIRYSFFFEEFSLYVANVFIYKCLSEEQKTKTRNIFQKQKQ
jgi:hypothetical protein